MYPIGERSTYATSLRDDAGYHTMGTGKFLNKFFSERGLDGTNRVETFGEPEDPYQQYLEEHGLADVHYGDFERRSNWPVDPTPLPEEAYNDVTDEMLESYRDPDVDSDLATKLNEVVSLQ
jgi:1-acyl-sn-glycerol-3-phosphate acyltransferase